MEQHNSRALLEEAKQVLALAREDIIRLRQSLKKAEEGLAFTEEWYGARWEHLADLLRDTEYWKAAANIMANGTREAGAPPTHQRMLVFAKHRAEKAEASVGLLREALMAQHREWTTASEEDFLRVDIGEYVRSAHQDIDAALATIPSDIVDRLKKSKRP